MQTIINKLNQTKFAKLRPRALYAILLTLALVLGLVTLFINKGFYYSDYQAGIVLQFPADTKVSFFDRFSGERYVSKVNRDLKQIRYQGLTLPQVNNVIQNLEIKPVQIIEQHQVLPVSLVGRVVWISLLAIFVTFAFVYYSIIRKLKKLSKLYVALISVLKLISLSIGMLIYLGVISLVSRVYQLTDTSLLGLIVAGLLGLVSVYISLQSVLNFDRQVYDLYDLELETLGATKLFFNRIWKLALLGLLFISIGMGINFAFDGLLLWLGIFIVICSVWIFPEFILILWKADWTKLNSQTVENKIIANEIITSLPSQVVKKSNRKISKPKSKRRR